MTALEAGTEVVVCASGSAVQFPTTVRDAVPGRVTLAPPPVALLRRPADREQALVAWRADGARYELPVQVVGVEDDGGWHVAPVGEPQRIQRRRFFRVPLVRTCRVEAADVVVHGTVRDLSEGGVLCRIPRECTPADGDPVHLDLMLDDDLVSVAGVVVSLTAGGESTFDLRVSFSDARASDVLRRHVFAYQVRDRSLRA